MMIRHLAVCDACEKTEPCDIQYPEAFTVKALSPPPTYAPPLHWKRIWDMGIFCSWRCLADWARRQEEVTDATD